MRNFKDLIINLHQRINRQLNSGYLEQIYQVSYLDIARRTSWLDDVPMSSPKGGTASFSLLYILLTILRDEKLDTILELGVGQSTKLFSQYVKNYKKKLTSIDDDEFWLNMTIEKGDYIEPVYAKLSPRVVNDIQIDWYDCDRPSLVADLVLIDGPKAFSKSIKYNRLGVLSWLPDILNDEFIIVVDDVNREGEDFLVKKIIEKCKYKDIVVKSRKIVGRNSQFIIATEKYFKYLYL